MRELETLRLVYADRVRERDRLRDARRSVTTKLGPIPASAGVIVGLFAALGPDIERGWMALLFGLALIPFVLVMVTSALTLRERSYRELETEAEAPRPGPEQDSLDEADWLQNMIAFERQMFPKLEKHFEQERSNLLRVQVLLGVEVVYLSLVTVLEPCV